MAERDNELTALENQIARLISQYEARKAVLDDRDTPFVVGWAVSYEYTSSTHEQSGMAGLSVIAPDEQPVSSSLGLGLFMQQSFTPAWTPNA